MASLNKSISVIIIIIITIIEKINDYRNFEFIFRNRPRKRGCSKIYIHIVKDVFKLYEILKIVIYHHALCLAFTVTHFLNTDLIVAFFLFGSFTHLSVFNNLTRPQSCNPFYPILWRVAFNFILDNRFVRKRCSKTCIHHVRHLRQ